MAETAGTALARLLADAGVRRFYTVPGESFLEVLDGADRDSRVTLVSTRHESGASFMAEAEGKLTGVPAVVMATRAVGASNAAIGVHTAFQDSTPMIVVLGQVETGFLGREAFQEVDLREFYRPLVKWSAMLLDPARVGEVVRRAYDEATTGRPGPVLIVLPADVSGTLVPEPAALPPRVVAPAGPPPREVTESIAARLRAASAPVVIAGPGVRAGRDLLVQAASRYGLGVYAAFRRQDIYHNDDPHYLGHLTLNASPVILESLEQADLVIALGTRLDEITTQSYRLPSATADVVQVDTDPGVLAAAFRPTTAVLADPARFLDKLLFADGGGERTAWRAGNQRYRAHSTPPAPASSADPIHPADAIAALAAAAPPGTIVTNDAGNFSIFLHRYWRFTTPLSQAAPTSGAMGYAVPGGIGAALAFADRPVLAVAGDGGFLMTGQEIETAVRSGISLVVAVLRNGLYGTIAMHQQRAFGRTAGIAIGDVDIAAFARSLGATGVRPSDAVELRDLAAAAFTSGGVTVLDVPIDPSVLKPAP
ncbi:MAG: thiamine pyrophosphate-dependent enzyme [Streptosporangiaceae bacterium]|jgi:acetolactate synthase-1/2/3 large subunit